MHKMCEVWVDTDPKQQYRGVQKMNNPDHSNPSEEISVMAEPLSTYPNGVMFRTKDRELFFQHDILAMNDRKETFPITLLFRDRTGYRSINRILSEGYVPKIYPPAYSWRFILENRDGLLIGLKESQFDQVVDTNLKGAFLCMQLAAKRMIRQRSGRIISISSFTGVHGNAGQTNYAASKAGLIGLTKSAARELGSRGITVNAIAPGYIDTDMTAALSDQVKETILAEIPLKRIGMPEDIAAAAAFLASDDAAYITGQVLEVGGGMGL